MPRPETGLCTFCTYRKVVVTDKGSEFIRCLNASLPKYPRLPVLSCSGFHLPERHEPAPEGALH